MVVGMNSSMIIFDTLKNLCKCHSVPPTQHSNKGKKTGDEINRKWIEGLNMRARDRG
jgi:hypothetical protein